MGANQDLTRGNITASLLKFAWPFMVGNLLPQLGSGFFPSVGHGHWTCRLQAAASCNQLPNGASGRRALQCGLFHSN